MELACQIELCPPYGYRIPYIFSFIAPAIRRRAKRSIAKLHKVIAIIGCRLLLTL